VASQNLPAAKVALLCAGHACWLYCRVAALSLHYHDIIITFFYYGLQLRKTLGLAQFVWLASLHLQLVNLIMVMPHGSSGDPSLEGLKCLGLRHADQSSFRMAVMHGCCRGMNFWHQVP
jgi:hypothetical protein